MRKCEWEDLLREGEINPNSMLWPDLLETIVCSIVVILFYCDDVFKAYRAEKKLIERIGCVRVSLPEEGHYWSWIWHLGADFLDELLEEMIIEANSGEEVARLRLRCVT